jgi:holo-ACP synthase
MVDRRSGPEPSLEAVLAAREARVERRAAAFAAGAAAVVVVTPVMPGPVKDCGIAREVQEEALAALERLFTDRRWRTSTVAGGTSPTGPEAIVAVAADPLEVKRATVEIEESHPIGRLFDIDVAGPDGAVSRSRLGRGPRRCLVCDRPAHACARSRTHAIDDVLAAMEVLLDARSRT